MSTPDPALVAASPYLKQALGYVKQFLSTVLTGDPLLLPGRVGPAQLVLLGQLQLLVPGLATAEEGAVLQQATSGIDGLIAKLP